MSQSGRRGSTQKLSGSQRMPFEAAEALLWGRETHRQHQLLFPRMKELEEQHQAYDARIQATEAVAEAAEAATSRVRRIEQQIAAIESDEQDRPFDKWVEGEIASFKGFVEQNKTVRQKQIELETKISDLEDFVDRHKDASRDVEILLDRIGRLETGRVNDAERIKRLEKAVLNLTSIRSMQATGRNDIQPVTTRAAIPKQVLPSLPTRQNPEASDAADETDDEDMLSPYVTHRPEPERVQVPQSPTIMPKSTSTVLPSSPTKERGNMSARLRVMQRKSFYEPKQPRENEQRQALVPALASKPASRPRPRPKLPPATQIINRAGLDIPLPATETRTPGQTPAKQLIIKLSIRKRKVEEAVSSTRLTRSQAKKNNDSAHARPGLPVSMKINSTVQTQSDEPAAKRRKPNTTRVPPQARPKAKPVSNAANLVKTSPRKAAVTAKRDNPVSNPMQLPTQLPSSPRKKQASRSNAVAGLNKPHGRLSAKAQDAGSSVTKTALPGRPSTPSGSTIPPDLLASHTEQGTTSSSKLGTASSRPGSKARHGLQRPPFAMPVTFDSDTYEDMKRKGKFIF